MKTSKSKTKKASAPVKRASVWSAAIMKSKIKPEHLTFLRVKLASVRDKLPAHRETLKSDKRVKDLEMRVRWDALHASVPSQWICDNLYPYGINDTHIDNALRNIISDWEGANQ